MFVQLEAVGFLRAVGLEGEPRSAFGATPGVRRERDGKDDWFSSCPTQVNIALDARELER
jgi:hypothetical protein